MVKKFGIVMRSGVVTCVLFDGDMKRLWEELEKDQAVFAGYAERRIEFRLGATARERIDYIEEYRD